MYLKALWLKCDTTKFNTVLVARDAPILISVLTYYTGIDTGIGKISTDISNIGILVKISLSNHFHKCVYSPFYQEFIIVRVLILSICNNKQNNSLT